jgi:hypothetical protein
LRDVVVVFAVFGAGLGVEEVIACDQFEGLAMLVMSTLQSPEHETHHRGHAPDIGASTPFRTENNLRRAVLPSLDVIGEVMIHPARIAQISNLDGYRLKRHFFESLLRGCATRMIKVNA